MRRRTWLALGAGSAVALLLAGGSLALLQPGLRDAKLTAGGREVFGGAARGLLAGTLPAGAPALQASGKSVAAPIQSPFRGTRDFGVVT